jgi:hypothetical protein
MKSSESMILYIILILIVILIIVYLSNNSHQKEYFAKRCNSNRTCGESCCWGGHCRKKQTCDKKGGSDVGK